MMSSITFTLECPVCLDTLRDPVVPPCGHLICELCIRMHVSLSANPYEAKCPTCRASFPIVLPNLYLIPNKYHVFIKPPLRRVYLGDRVDNNKAVINDLESKVVCLEARIETLKSRNESTKRELCLTLDKAKEDARLALDEAKKEAQLALDEVKEDAQLALDLAKYDLRVSKLNLEECRAENNALKSKVKRYRSVRNTSGRSAFNIPSKDTSPRCGNCTTKSSPKPMQLLPADQSFGYFGLANDMSLTSAAREALAALSSSPTSPSVASAQSGSSTVSTVNNMPSLAMNQVPATTTSVAGESGATSDAPILDRSPTPPLLYPTLSTPSSPTIF